MIVTAWKMTIGFNDRSSLVAFLRGISWNKELGGQSRSFRRKTRRMGSKNNNTNNNS